MNTHAYIEDTSSLSLWCPRTPMERKRFRDLTNRLTARGDITFVRGKTQKQILVDDAIRRGLIQVPIS